MTGQAGGLCAALGRPWWVRLRAVLATGLVLGVGTTTTLAAWTDQVDVEASFGASTFVVEANTTTPYVDGSWSAYSDETAELQFDIPATDMTPGSTRYASLALRAGAGSLGGDASLTAHGADGGLGAALQYRVITSRTCDSAAFDAAAGAAYLVGSPGASVSLATGQDPEDPVGLPEGSEDPAAPGDPVHLCVEVSLPEGAPTELQGQQATARWTVEAISETT